MPKKGNGVDLAVTNEYLRQILDLSREQNTRLGHLEEQQKEHAEVLKEQSAVLREQSAVLKGIQADIRQLNHNMTQVASFVGQDKARQDHKIEDIERRLEVLERKAA